MLRALVEEAEKLLTSSKDQLKQAEEYLKKNEGLTSSIYYAIKVFKDPPAST